MPFGFSGCVHANETELIVTVEVVKADGLVQVGTGAQVTLASQPAATVESSEVNTKVKHPLEAEDVKGPGNAFPVRVPE